MPLPLLIVVPALIAGGGSGAYTLTKGVLGNKKAKTINENANQRIEDAKYTLEHSKDACAVALDRLGELKLNMLGNSVNRFIDAFGQLKNVELTDSVGLEELRNFHIDRASFDEMEELGQLCAAVAGGAAAGLAGGALAAMGAYGAAGALAHASTGTAIAALGGAAAKNATLAFFGGGALSAGGLGMAGGAMVLGGIVAAPALAVCGFIVNQKAKAQLEEALANEAKSNEIAEQLNTAAFQCNAIRRRTYMFYGFLSRLDAKLLPLVFQMEDIIKNEGVDFSQFKDESKKVNCPRRRDRPDRQVDH